MYVDFGQIFEVMVLVFLMRISNDWSGALGGAFHMGVSATLFTRLRPLMVRLLQKPLYLAAVTKVIAWLISSSGLLIGLAIHNIFWGAPNSTADFVTILVVALISVLGIAHDLIYFDQEYSYIDALWPQVKGFMGNLMRGIETKEAHNIIRRLSRSVFVDQTLTTLFRLLVTIGVIYYCLGQLDLFELSGAAPPDIWQSLILSFSTIDITGSIESPFHGQTWELIRTISAFLTFFWLVMFFALASASVEDAAEQVIEMWNDEEAERIQQMVARAAAIQAMQQMANTETTE